MTPQMLEDELMNRVDELGEVCHLLQGEKDINGIQQMAASARSLGVEIDYYAYELFKALETLSNGQSDGGDNPPMSNLTNKEN